MVSNQVPVISPLVVRLVSVVILGVLGAAALLDFYLALVDSPPLGLRIRTWGRRYPGFMAAVALVFGVLVGHFFFSVPE